MSDDITIRDYIDTRIESINRRLDTIAKMHEVAIVDSEKRLNDKLADRDKVIQKADDVMDDRLDQMNRFRDQINSERVIYVTRDQLEINLKSLHDQIAILTRTMTLSSGAKEGASSVGSIVLNVLVGISALMSGLSTFLVITNIFSKH